MRPCILKAEFRRALRLLLLITVASQLAACGHQPLAAATPSGLPVSLGVSSCRDLLAAPEPLAADELDASRISLFNWNVQKSRQQSWRDDFDAFSNDADLVLFQEASLREVAIRDLDSSRHWSFAPGYRRDGEVTGVMTLSSIAPLTRCSFINREPLLRTPKATSITRYALSNSEQTLIVVNIHAVNFSLGLGAYERQFAEIRDSLSAHAGPVILSGDLNTWRGKRVRIVEELANDLQLQAVAFVDDHRVRVFGNALDHIYVRGLHALDARTDVVETSDHNPMSAVFSLPVM